jgi:hypothetical protein
MTSVANKPRTVTAPIGKMISRLEVFVSRMERRYECTSEAMENDVKAGRARETAEISRWLGEYHALAQLRAHGGVTGSTTSDTR